MRPRGCIHGRLYLLRFSSSSSIPFRLLFFRPTSPHPSSISLPCWIYSDFPYHSSPFLSNHTPRSPIFSFCYTIWWLNELSYFLVLKILCVPFWMSRYFSYPIFCTLNYFYLLFYLGLLSIKPKCDGYLSFFRLLPFNLVFFCPSLPHSSPYWIYFLYSFCLLPF